MTIEPSNVHNSRLWVGTWWGLHALDLQEDSIQQILNAPDNPSSLSNNRVISLLEYSHGTLWVGTADGLAAYDGHGGFIRYALLSPNPASATVTNLL